MFVFVFFVKQKTAYDMRISDWSLDVCSSGLDERLAADGQGLLESVGGGGCVAGGTGPASGLGAVDHLGLGEAEESPGAVLDADAAPLGTAEGLVGGQRQVGVDPRGAALQVLGDLRRSLDVGAPHRAGQPVVGGVGPLDDLVDVAVGADGQRWTEMLLVEIGRAHV